MKDLGTLCILCICMAAAAQNLTVANVLVVGGAGFVGSNLIIALHKHGCKSISSYDIFDAESDIHIKRKRADRVLNLAKVTITEGDVCDPKFNFNSLRKFTHIFHFGAIPQTSEPQCFDSVLAKIIKRNTTVLPTVFYASPLYGKGNVRGAKAWTNLRDRFDRYGIPIALFLLPTVYGPFDKPESMISKLTMAALTDDTPQIGEWDTSSFIYIDDLIDWMILTIVKKFDSFALYTFSGIPMSVSSVQKVISRCLNTPSEAPFDSLRQQGAAIMTTLQLPNLSVPKVFSIGHEYTTFDRGIRAYTDWVIDYETRLTPCISECSYSRMCFNSSWDDAARISRSITAGCSTVVYTVSTQKKTTHLHPAPADNIGCNIAFINRNCTLYSNLSAFTSGDVLQYRNWSLIPLSGFDSYFTDPRKPTRIPKLNPGRFFVSNVSYAVYFDSAILLLKPLKDMVHYFISTPRTKAVFAAVNHPLRINSLFDEINNVQVYMKQRKYLTLTPQANEHYKSMAKAYQRKFPKMAFGVVFDGSLLIHDLRSIAARKFRCTWYRQYQQWSDRDQLSGSFTLGYLHYQQMKSGKFSEWIPIGSNNNHLEYARVLPKKNHPLFWPKPEILYYSKITLPFNP